MWLLAVALSLAVRQDHPSRPVIEINSTAIAFANEQPRSLAFEYDEAAVTRLIPRHSRGASLYLHCRGFNADGRLTECSLDLDPKGEGYEAAANAFVDSVRIRPNKADMARRDEVLTAWIQLSLWNGDRRPAIRCRPPGCVGTLPAPEPSTPPP